MLSGEIIETLETSIELAQGRDIDVGCLVALGKANTGFMEDFPLCLWNFLNVGQS